MDDRNITMEEYIRLEEEKARRRDIDTCLVKYVKYVMIGKLTVRECQLSSSCNSAGHIEAVPAGYDIVPAGYDIVPAGHVLGDPRVDNDLGIVDSGCSRSMTGNKEMLDDFVQVKGSIVKFGGGDGRISGRGTIRTSKLDFK
nr:hypothetical protein [Tanacetum cinerariifolium]